MALAVPPCGRQDGLVSPSTGCGLRVGRESCMIATHAGKVPAPVTTFTHASWIAFRHVTLSIRHTPERCPLFRYCPEDYAGLTGAMVSDVPLSPVRSGVMIHAVLNDQFRLTRDQCFIYASRIIQKAGCRFSINRRGDALKGSRNSVR